MFQNQLINAVVSWEWQLKMAEEIQKNLQGKPHEVEVEPVQPNARVPFWKLLFASRQANQPVYTCCASEPCGEVGLG
ncbi:MAG: hypothetical protein IPM53_02475 [Anaerolineaceae bacterium]|nr:hypothetical protein [Anaerolineaceae bacterium]